jgi:hypothetical protein
LSLYYNSLAPAKSTDLESGPQPVAVPPTKPVLLIEQAVDEKVENEIEADKEIGENVALLSGE